MSFLLPKACGWKGWNPPWIERLNCWGVTVLLMKILQCRLCDLRMMTSYCWYLLIYVICSVPVFVKTLLQTHRLPTVTACWRRCLQSRTSWRRSWVTQNGWTEPGKSGKSGRSGRWICRICRFWIFPDFIWSFQEAFRSVPKSFRHRHL